MDESKGDRIGEKQFFDTLDHEIRRQILLYLHDQVEMSYTDILHALKIPEGTLNFHLKKLAKFIQRTENGTYILSEKGKVSIDLIHTVRRLEGLDSQSKLSLKKPILTKDLVMRRIGAFLLDALVFIVFTGIFFDPTLRATIEESVLHFGSILEPHAWIFHAEHLPMVGEIVYVTVAIHAHIFFAIFIFLTMVEAYKGQTPGKFIMGIRVVKVSGEKMSFLEAGIRNAGKVFLLPLDLIVGLIFCVRNGYLRFLDTYIEVTVERVTNPNLIAIDTDK